MFIYCSDNVQIMGLLLVMMLMLRLSRLRGMTMDYEPGDEDNGGCP